MNFTLSWSGIAGKTFQEININGKTQKTNESFNKVKAQ